MGRIKPLLDLNLEVAKVNADFEKQWTEGSFAGWPKETSGMMFLYSPTFLYFLLFFLRVGRGHLLFAIFLTVKIQRFLLFAGFFTVKILWFYFFTFRTNISPYFFGGGSGGGGVVICCLLISLLLRCTGFFF